jgi:protein-S-isoprenylcysteine O-methyltransferase Ste14
MRRPGAALGSAVFFLATPCVVAGVLPWLICRWSFGHHSPGWLPVRIAGTALTAAGAALLVLCFVRFVTEGRGTPAPVAPTEVLVVGGAYRYVRNPMYVAVVAVITGQALLFVSVGVLGYALAVWALTASFVRWYEEPTLARRYGAQFERYRAAVPAWLPRVRPWTAPVEN